MSESLHAIASLQERERTLGEESRFYQASIVPTQYSPLVGAADQGSVNLDPRLLCSVADPHHVDADPDPAFHFDTDPDPTCHSDLDPEPTTPFFPDLGLPML